MTIEELVDVAYERLSKGTLTHSEYRTLIPVLPTRSKKEFSSLMAERYGKKIHGGRYGVRLKTVPPNKKFQSKKTALVSKPLSVVKQEPPVEFKVTGVMLEKISRLNPQQKNDFFELYEKALYYRNCAIQIIETNQTISGLKKELGL